MIHLHQSYIDKDQQFNNHLIELHDATQVLPSDPQFGSNDHLFSNHIVSPTINIHPINILAPSTTLLRKGIHQVSMLWHGISMFYHHLSLNFVLQSWFQSHIPSLKTLTCFDSFGYLPTASTFSQDLQHPFGRIILVLHFNLDEFWWFYQHSILVVH